MKKATLAIALCLFSAILMLSCNSNTAPKDNKTPETAAPTVKDSSKTVVAKFISGGSSEGDAIFVFQKEDGSKIEFYRNYNDPKEPKLKYEFLSQEGVSGNKGLLGATFTIKYVVNPTGQVSMVSGKGEACNQIISAEIK
ncbi:MAG: hypothetical protein WCH34_09575 [Bacteroidota bacterium]